MKLAYQIFLVLCLAPIAIRVRAAEESFWQAGVAQTKITPKKLMWMGGFAARTKPAEGTLDELYAKALVLRTPDGTTALLVTLDLVGVPKWLYDQLASELKKRHGLSLDSIRFSASHTHSAPVLRDALTDIYPLDDAQRALINEYSEWIGPAILEMVDRAFANLAPATLFAGDGKATFACNRRTNIESEAIQKLIKGVMLEGPTDTAVPVLAIQSPDGILRAVIFGYAAHATVLTNNYLWSGDYPGVAERLLEASHPGAQAMFFQGCGSDQSALPRGTVEECQKRGQEMASSVEAVLAAPMRRLPPRLRTAHEFINLDFGEQPTSDELKEIAKGNAYQARWAARLLSESANGRIFEKGYPNYPVQVWRLGDDQLWIALGGEVCVEYALRFQREFQPHAWVAGYSNDVMAYIPSRQVWEAKGYQAGAFEVYGLPATRWCADIEDRIAASVGRLVERVKAQGR